MKQDNINARYGGDFQRVGLCSRFCYTDQDPGGWRPNNSKCLLPLWPRLFSSTFNCNRSKGVCDEIENTKLLHLLYITIVTYALPLCANGETKRSSVPNLYDAPIEGYIEIQKYSLIVTLAVMCTHLRKVSLRVLNKKYRSFRGIHVCTMCMQQLRCIEVIRYSGELE